MSIYYLIDPFTVGGDIVDVVTSETGQIEATGSTVIRVPDGVAIRGNPTNLTDLLTAKYSGLMSFYAGFTDMLSDPCIGANNFDPASFFFFNNSSGWVNPSLSYAGSCDSVPFALGFAPTQCVVVWEEFIFTDLDDKAGRFRRTYVEDEVLPNVLECIFSFDGWAHSSVPVSNGEVYNIPVPNQGTSFTIRFSNNTAGYRKYIGSWALFYL